MSLHYPHKYFKKIILFRRIRYKIINQHFISKRFQETVRLVSINRKRTDVYEILIPWKLLLIHFVPKRDTATLLMNLSGVVQKKYHQPQTQSINVQTVLFEHPSECPVCKTCNRNFLFPLMFCKCVNSTGKTLLLLMIRVIYLVL